MSCFGLWMGLFELVNAGVCAYLFCGLFCLFGFIFGYLVKYLRYLSGLSLLRCVSFVYLVVCWGYGCCFCFVLMLPC